MRDMVRLGESDPSRCRLIIPDRNDVHLALDSTVRQDIMRVRVNCPVPAKSAEKGFKTYPLVGRYTEC